MKPVFLAFFAFCFSQQLLAESSDSTVASSPEPEQTDTPAIRNKAQVMPQFPGGEMKMFEYLRNELT